MTTASPMKGSHAAGRIVLPLTWSVSRISTSRLTALNQRVFEVYQVLGGFIVGSFLGRGRAFYELRCDCQPLRARHLDRPQDARPLLGVQGFGDAVQFFDIEMQRVEMI